MPRTLTVALQEAKDWPPELDPAEYLTAYEVKAAKVYFQLQSQMPPVPTASQRLEFQRALVEAWPLHFSRPWEGVTEKQLMANRAWVAFLRKLKTDIPKRVMEYLEDEAMSAAGDFVWARKRAKQTDDYKEVRVGASDHLDKIGASRKQTDTGAGLSLTIILKGRNFEVETLDSELPEVKAEEIVVQDPEIVEGG